MSLDCGGKYNFKYELGLEWSNDPMSYRKVPNISVANETWRQYIPLRYFCADVIKIIVAH